MIQAQVYKHRTIKHCFPKVSCAQESLGRFAKTQSACLPYAVSDSSSLGWRPGLHLYQGSADAATANGRSGFLPALCLIGSMFPSVSSSTQWNEDAFRVLRCPNPGVLSDIALCASLPPPAQDKGFCPY